MTAKKNNGTLLARIDERVEAIKENFSVCMKRLNNHSGRLSLLEKFQAESSEPIFRVDELMLRVDELESFKDKNSTLDDELEYMRKDIRSLNNDRFKLYGIALTVPVIVTLLGYFLLY